MEKQTKKICPQCHISKPIDDFRNSNHYTDGKSCWCKDCDNKASSERYYKNRKEALAKMKDYYEKNKQKCIDKTYLTIKRHPKKWKARCHLRDAVRVGKIKKQPCEICGEIKVEAHHDNYNKPFDVRWLCKDCHHKLHRKKR
jgi:hypothetical protein